MSAGHEVVTARESARRYDGQFGSQRHAEPALSLSAPDGALPEWVPSPASVRRRLTDALGRRLAARDELRMTSRLHQDFCRGFDVHREGVPEEHLASFHGMLDAKDQALEEDRESMRSLREAVECCLGTDEGLEQVLTMHRAGTLGTSDLELDDESIRAMTIRVREQNGHLARLGIGTGISEANKARLQRAYNSGAPVLRIDTALSPGQEGYLSRGEVLSQSVRRQRFVEHVTGEVSVAYWADWEVRTDAADSILLYRTAQDFRPSGIYVADRG